MFKLKSTPAPEAKKTEKKGEMNELKQQLRDPAIDKDEKKKRETLKRVIAFMTLGVDTSVLMSEMILASATKDVVQKKMVYLYMTTHAESSSDIAILAINTLQKDCKDESPLVRGLALRSLSSLRLPNIVEYVQPFVKNGLTDQTAYVRKTAVIAAGKLYKYNKEAFKAMNLVDKLYGMIRDGDAAVCCNSIVILNEVQEEGIAINKNIVFFLLNRLRDLNEWQQCLVMNLVLKFVPEKEQDMFDIMNLMEERLRGSNSAVILAATNVFLTITQNLPDLHKKVYTRLRDPLVTLAATAPVETAYSVLAHIKLLVSRVPEVFTSSYKEFYIRHTDPYYIRALKLDVLVAIADEKNMREIIPELAVHSTDVQAETSRAAIRALGQITLKLPSAADECTRHFLEFLDTEQGHVRSETFIILKDYMRKYNQPQKLKPFFSSIVKNWKSVEDKESKVALIWMLGEFGDEIDDSPYILEHFKNRFNDEPYLVRIELLTASMKLFFKRPPEMRPILGPLLQQACTDFTHADVHDRALLYYRLLQHNPRVALQVVSSKKDPITRFADDDSHEIKDKLFEEFNTLSVIYNLPSERFIRQGEVLGALEKEEEAADDGSDVESDESDDDDSDIDSDEDMEGGLLQEKKKKGGKMKLQDCTLTPAVFQQTWQALPVAKEFMLKFSMQPEAENLEKLCGNHQIFTVASGQMNSSLKFYFYAQASGSAQFILAEAVVDIGGQCNVKLKGEEPRIAEFQDVFSVAMKSLTS